MIDWSWVDWDMVIAIAGTTWGVTILVTVIASLVALAAGAALRKIFTKSKKNSNKGK